MVFLVACIIALILFFGIPAICFARMFINGIKNANMSKEEHEAFRKELDEYMSKKAKA